MILPTLFIPHGGGPCFFMDPPPQAPHLWEKMAAYLRGIPAGLPQRPKALLVISAHWEERVPTLNINPLPPMLFDYYGFPEHTYRLNYPAQGAPELAARVAALLRADGHEVGFEAERGFDHGVFVPLMLMFPKADIPVLQLSLCADLDPARHIAIGAALAPLRAENVLIMGSGMSYHNLQHFLDVGANAAARAFDGWLGEALEDCGRREALLTGWLQAPFARVCHPREEHLLPLMVAAGAARGEPARCEYREGLLGNLVSGYRFG